MTQREELAAELYKFDGVHPWSDVAEDVQQVYLAYADAALAYLRAVLGREIDKAIERACSHPERYVTVRTRDEIRGAILALVSKP